MSVEIVVYPDVPHTSPICYFNLFYKYFSIKFSITNRSATQIMLRFDSREELDAFANQVISAYQVANERKTNTETTEELEKKPDISSMKRILDPET